jgi:hypothetical protein
MTVIVIAAIMAWILREKNNWYVQSPDAFSFGSEQQAASAAIVTVDVDALGMRLWFGNGP